MDHPLVIGVDVGGTNLQFGVVDGTNRVVGRARAKTEASGGLKRIVGNIDAGIRAAAADAGVELDEVAAVGVAAAGAIDVPRGVIITAPNLALTEIPLRDILAERTGRPVVLDNDVNAAVWAEHQLGPIDGDTLGVWVGTGVGGGLVLGGRLYHGDAFTAGEIGHTVVLPDEAPGARTVEDQCSRSGLRERIAERANDEPGSALVRAAGGDVMRIGSEELRVAYTGGDPLAVELIDRAAELLGVAMANWVTVLALRTVILGGGMTEALGAPFAEKVTRSLEANVFPPEIRCRVVTTRLTADAGLIGAAMLAR